MSLADLRLRRSEKWRAFPGEILPAFVAEMDYSLAPAIQDALVAAVRMGDTGYAWPLEELGVALADFVHDRFGWMLDAGDVSLIPDVMVGVTEVLRGVLKPGDSVVINTPVYPPFFSRIREAGGKVAEAPLEWRPEGYRLDLDAVEAQFKAGARAYLLCNPHNPTGLVLERVELERIAEMADRHGVTVLADEIHSPLVLPGARHTPFLSLGEIATGLGVAFVSASKAWNVPGLKCAQLVASGPMRSVKERLPAGIEFRAGLLGVVAAIAAYTDGRQWLDELLLALDHKRFLMKQLIAAELPQVSYVPPAGGYLAWLDCRRLGIDGEPAEFFRRRGHVALGAGENFGDAGRGFVRLTMATSDEILREIISRMRSAVQSRR